MGYGVWNPSLLEDDSRALHVGFAKAEDELDRDEVEFVRQCDEEDMLAAADSIAAAFDVQVDEREGWHKSYGDRYQCLKSRFEIDKAGLFYRNRPSDPVPRRCRGLQRSTTCLSSPNDTRQPGSFSQSTLAVF